MIKDLTKTGYKDKKNNILVKKGDRVRWKTLSQEIWTGVVREINNNVDDKSKNITKIEIWVQEIKGINYYVDSMNNVYKPEDIISNKPNPAIIAKWSLSDTGVYKIPSFGI